MKSILVTGGTGSFGRAFTKRLLGINTIERIVIYSRGEHAQESMAREYGNGRIRYFIGDVRDHDRLAMAMRGIETVVHAAALKVVPIAEYNPTECVATNIGGAQNVVQAALTASVRTVIALSTDKAVNPINLYGATKLCAEKIFIAANNLSAGRTNFSVVRYGNVAGSQGSVLPLFLRLAAEGKTLPVTHPNMTRFWITMEEAIDLVLTALAVTKGREIFVPRIPSINIADLAQAISPDNWEITGIRPGEKMHEALIAEGEPVYTDSSHGHFILRPHQPSTGSGGQSYSSDANEDFLSPDQIKEKLNEEAWSKNPERKDQVDIADQGKE